MYMYIKQRKASRYVLTIETRHLCAADLSTTSTCTRVTAIGGRKALSYPVPSTVILTT